jgi:hypothetical protein
MRKLLVVPFVVATLLLGAGVAEARPSTYTVSRSWVLAYVDGTPTVQPHIQDDYVEVTCRNGDRMKYYRVNDRHLVLSTWPRIDKTGIQIIHRFAKRNATLRVTVTCRRH